MGGWGKRFYRFVFLFSYFGPDIRLLEKILRKIRWGFLRLRFSTSDGQAVGGQKGRGWGEGIFARLLSAPKERLGREAARPCISKEAKPAKIDSLIEKIFCAHPLKNVSIFAGFVQRSGGEPLGGSGTLRAPVSPVRKRFARSV